MPLTGISGFMDLNSRRETIALTLDSAGGAFDGHGRIQAEALCDGKNQDVLLSHAENSNTPDGIASESTYVCSPLVWVKSEGFSLTEKAAFLD